ncbi:hypothetical protein [Ethanoligenens sp.]|uniref:hypothetical protein n=1 Tax=Ethanoligenens sp. TaxID=2099655 RepID=UPI0039EBF46D
MKEIKAWITRLYNWAKQQATAQPEAKQSVWEQLQQTQAAIRSATRYGKVKALKESAALFNFLQENGVSSIQELYAKVTAMQTEYYSLRSQIAATDRQISGLKTHLSMWKQYTDNKPFRQRLSALKPRAQAAYQYERYTEFALYEAAVRYLNGLKDRSEKITPKVWQAEIERLTAHNNALCQRMKAMRPEIHAVEKIRQTADRLARMEKSRDQRQEYDR